MTELLELADRVLGRAHPGEDVEVYGHRRVSTTVQAGTGGDIRQVGRAETRGLGVRLITGGRMGYASTADLSPAALDLTLGRARNNARLGDVDAANVLADPGDAGVLDAGFASQRLAVAALEDKIGVAASLARRVVGIDPRVRACDTVEYHDEQTDVTIASTVGMSVEYTRAYAEVWVDALGEDANGAASDFAYWCGRDVAAVDVEDLAQRAVARTVRLLGPVVGRPGGLPVVLDRAVAAALLAVIGRSCAGVAQAFGRSPFAVPLGSEVAAPVVTLVDNGTLEMSPAAATYDDEGVPRRRTELIAEGRLVGTLHSTATAAAVGGGARSTGNARRATHKTAPRAAPSTLLLMPTTSDADMVSGLGDVLYIQQLTGAGVGINAVTGRVDVGCVGALLRAGEAVGRIATIPLTTTLPSILRAVTAVADDAYQVPGAPVSAPTVVCAGGLFGAAY